MMKMKTILITGATSGIGKHAALHLARKGHRVIATGRNAAVLSQLQAEYPNQNFHVLILDVTQNESIAEAVVSIDKLTQNEGIDVLINNAGFMIPGPLAELTDENLRSQFDTNVFGLMAVTRAFLPKMFERKRGRILNISSVSGRIPAPLFGAYHASKYALEALSDALRMELQPFGIQVVIIEPGTIRTEFANRSIDAAKKALLPNSRYLSAFANADAMGETVNRIAVGPECVVRAIEKAVLSSRPCARYVAPKAAWVGIPLMAILPTWFTDSLLRRLFGLTRARLEMR
jgi:short-subunit dehydrogenase